METLNLKLELPEQLLQILRMTADIKGWTLEQAVTILLARHCDVTWEGDSRLFELPKDDDFPAAKVVLTNLQLDAVLAAVRQDNYIMAIKLVREYSGCLLAEAKRVVDQLREEHG